MAGRGPAPGANPNTKPASQRRNRNKPAPLDGLPADGYRGEFPKLPASYATGQLTKGGKPKTRTFMPSTKRWYEAWARSPMAVEFTTVHWLRLQSIAVLQDRYDRGEHELAGEIRLQLAGFGGTPYDVRRLGKTIKPNVPADRAAAPPKLASVTRLHAV